MKKRIGLITFHSAYNFGSCLQAFATCRVIKELGYDCTILNYRPESQADFYTPFHFNRGARRFLKSLLFLPSLAKYRARAAAYESFISGMPCTAAFSEPEQVTAYREQFDAFVSGSDQIWNKHANELAHVDWRYMDPYLLTFTDRKKVSYASSIVNMTDEELARIAPAIRRFASISVREADSVDRIRSIAGAVCTTVADPTLLLGKEEWSAEMAQPAARLAGERYLLYYTLGRIQTVADAVRTLSRLSKRRGLKLVVISPLAPLPPFTRAYHALEAGPREFLRLIHDAEVVVTDSYHGTMFSLNFEKNFYLIRPAESHDTRALSVLAPLGLTDRIVAQADAIPDGEDAIDYTAIRTKLDVKRSDSIAYLSDALGGT